MPDDLTGRVLYRLAYDRLRRRLEHYPSAADVAWTLTHPLEAAGVIDPVQLQDRVLSQAVRDAVDDALEGRPPRW
jgi:DNA-directed RNA polymerase specialized sigma24 family protein